uniref:Uncharacterized protein n=1 Tax=Oncorhynchus tshawytscha TaxID=74940 RepID=A0A8C8HTG9_ONCTS
MGPQILKRFYSCNIESILTSCVTAWYGNCSASDRKALQRVMCTALYITGAKLPAIQDLYTRQCQRKALKTDAIAVDQITTELCLQEIQACKRVSVGPRFLVDLLGSLNL